MQLKFILIYNFIFCLFLFTEVHGKTVLPDTDMPIVEIKLRCAEPEECTAQPEENVIFLETGDTYLNKDNEEVVVEDPGFLIVDKFVSLKNTKESPDDQFYSCGEGQNYILEDETINIEDLTQDEEIYNSLISDVGHCPCFWAPKSVLDTLNPETPPTEKEIEEIVSTSIPNNSTTYPNDPDNEDYFMNPCWFGCVYWPTGGGSNPNPPGGPDPKDPWTPDPDGPNPPAPPEPPPAPVSLWSSLGYLATALLALVGVAIGG